MVARAGKIAMFEQFAADGITTMFGNPGTSEENILDALGQRTDMQYMLTLHEAAAIGIADGYARAAGRPGLVQLHTGVGLGNGIGLLYQAMRGHSPLVVIAGEAGIKYDAMDAQMAADLVAMARPVTKWATRVLHPGSLLRVLQRAVKTAMTHPRGPVFVALPMDVLEADTAEPAVPSTIPSQRMLPVEAELDRAADLLRTARQPVILMGDGVADTGAQAELTRLAEVLGAPVWGVSDSEQNMDATHPLYQGQLGHMFGEDSQERLREADLVLIVGTYLFPEVFPLLDSPFRPGARLVHIDLDVYEIAKNFPVDVALAADPKSTMTALADRLAPTSEGRRERPVTYRKVPREAPADAPLVEKFAAELGQQAPSDLVVFDEALTASPALGKYLPARVPGSIHLTRGGSLGVGIPGAVGVKLARPEAEVVGFTGDGGSMYTIQALWTAARYGIGARFVICNNRRYRLLDLNLDRYWRDRGTAAHQYPDAFDLSQPEIDFAGLARALGVAAVRVDKAEQVEGAVHRMLNHTGPLLIDLDTA